METEITADTGEQRKSQEEALSLYNDESLRAVMRYAGGEDPLLAFGCSRPAVLVYVKHVRLLTLSVQWFPCGPTVCTPVP